MKKIQLILSVFIAAVMITSCSKDEPIVLSSLKGIDNFEIVFDGVDAKDVKTEKKGENFTISVPFKTSLAGLKPIIKVSDKATVSPASGTAIDFTDGVAKRFTVTAEDKTTKVYNVTINVLGEVGSGSKLKTYLYVRNFGGFFELDNKLTTYKYDEKSKFVSEYTIKNNTQTAPKESKYVLIYDSKNQIIEKKSDDDKISRKYTYNDKGQIASSTYTKDNTLTESYTYTYDANNNLIKTVVTDEKHKDKKQGTLTYEHKKGNMIKQNNYDDTTIIVYDDKNNPFKGMYPEAFEKIEIGANLINTNNPLKLSTSKDGVEKSIMVEDMIKYTYNTDSFPVKAEYSLKEGPTKITKQFTYNQ